MRLSIFDLSHGTLDDVQEGESVVEHDVAVDDTDQSIHYTEQLDLRRTANAHGRQFCFVRTVTMQNDKWINPPRVTHPCYRRGAGVDREEIRKRNEKKYP